MSNMVLKMHMFFYPWSFHNGSAEVAHDQNLVIKDITWYLRWRNFLPLTLWTAATVLCMIGVYFQATMNNRLSKLSDTDIAIVALVTIPMVFAVGYGCLPGNDKKERMKREIELLSTI